MAEKINKRTSSAFASYDAANKIATLNGGTIAYDGDGNTTSIAGAGVASGTWTWDARSLLTTAFSNGSQVAYGYIGCTLLNAPPASAMKRVSIMLRQTP